MLQLISPICQALRLCAGSFPSSMSSVRQFNSSLSSITKVHRKTYARTYPVVVVLPNGATINVKYHEPRKIIKLPLDLSTLSEADRKARVDKRKPRQTIRVMEELEDTFDSDKYLKYIRK